MAPNKLPTHYAAIVLSGKVLSIGVSGLAGCSKICKHAVTRHAEMDAISRIRDKNRLKKASIWSLRWRKINGEYVLANAKPCLYCQSIANKYGIKNVYYSTEDGTIEKANIQDLKCKLTAGSVLHLKHEKGYGNVIYTPHYCQKISNKSI